MSPTTEQGDESRRVFTSLFRREAERVTRLAYLLGADDPEDVAQEAFCKLYAARDRLLETGNTVAYLNRIVVNEVRSRYRRKVTASQHSPHAVSEESAEHHVMVSSAAAELLIELNRLSRAQREALVLRFWLDMPLDAIAQAMDTRVGTVKSHLHRGMKILAIELEEFA